MYHKIFYNGRNCLAANRKSIKGMIGVTGLVLIVRLCGSTPLVHYAGAIFKESGSTIDPNLSTVIMGTLQIVGYCCATIFMDLFGRKSLLLLSAAVGCVSLLVTSVFTYLVMHGTDLSSYNEVPVIFLSFFKFAIAIGIGPVPLVLIPELLPRNVSIDFFYFFLEYGNDFFYSHYRFVSLEPVIPCFCQVPLHLSF